MGLVSVNVQAAEDSLFNIKAEEEALQDAEIKFNVDTAHKEASDILNVFASQIDSFFAEEVASDRINKTKATLRFDLANDANDDFQFKAKFKVRLVLPRSEQRLRLLLDVDDDSDDENRSSVQSLAESAEEQNVALALRFLREANERINYNIDLGARRFESTFQGFARLKASLKENNDEGWSYKIENNLRQFFSSGYVNELRFDLWRNVRPQSSTVFRASTSFDWRKSIPGASIGQTFGVYKQLSSKSLIAYELLAAYRTSPDELQSHYEGHRFRVRYRRQAFRPWFHFELWPGVSWLTEQNNDAKLEGLVRAEIGIGKF